VPEPLHGRARRGGRSGAEPLASACTPRRNDLASTFGCHARAKAVAALAHQIARLKGPLHGLFSAGCRWPARCAQTRALIREAHASRQCEALPRHKRVSTCHKTVKVPFPCSRSAKIAAALAEKW
jgi:hypothetical protein